MSPRKYDRHPPEHDPNPEELGLAVRFEWHCLGKVVVKVGPPEGLDLPECRYPGVYRLRASATGGIEKNAWYVGQSMSSMDERIKEHVNEKYDAALDTGKIFRDRLQEPGGWSELDIAKHITINGNGELCGIENGCFISKEDIDALDEDAKRAVQFVMNLVESAGQVKGLEFFGPQGRR